MVRFPKSRSGIMVGGMHLRKVLQGGYEGFPHSKGEEVL